MNCRKTDGVRVESQDLKPSLFFEVISCKEHTWLGGLDVSLSSLHRSLQPRDMTVARYIAHIYTPWTMKTCHYIVQYNSRISWWGLGKQE